MRRHIIAGLLAAVVVLASVSLRRVSAAAEASNEWSSTVASIGFAPLPDQPVALSASEVDSVGSLVSAIVPAIGSSPVPLLASSDLEAIGSSPVPMPPPPTLVAIGSSPVPMPPPPTLVGIGSSPVPMPPPPNTLA